MRSWVCLYRLFWFLDYRKAAIPTHYLRFSEFAAWTFLNVEEGPCRIQLLRRVEAWLFVVAVCLGGHPAPYPPCSCFCCASPSLQDLRGPSAAVCAVLRLLGVMPTAPGLFPEIGRVALPTLPQTPASSMAPARSHSPEAGPLQACNLLAVKDRSPATAAILRAPEPTF